MVPFFVGVTERTQAPRASFFDVQVIVVFMLLHVSRAVVVPFLAVAEYDTPGALVKVAFTIPRAAMTFTLFGAATALSTKAAGVLVVAGAVVVDSAAGVEDGVAVLMRIFGEDYVKPVTDTVNLESL